jgi:hypothetical protein
MYSHSGCFAPTVTAHTNTPTLTAHTTQLRQQNSEPAYNIQHSVDAALFSFIFYK